MQRRGLLMGDLGVCLASVMIIVGCQTARPTPSSDLSGSHSGATGIPNTWMSGSEQNAEEGAYLSAKAAQLDSVEVRHVDCGADYTLISEGPATSEVGMAVDAEANADHTPRPFTRHYCKTDKAVMP